MGELTRYDRLRNLPVPAAPKLPGLGLLAAARMKVEAVCAEAAAEAEVRILAAQYRVLQVKQTIITTELSARLEAAKLAQQVEIEAMELGFWQSIRSAGSEARLSLIREATAFEELLSERQHARQHRLQGTRPQALQTASLPALNEPDIQVHVSRDAVEKMAIKAISRLGNLSGQAADQAWGAWRTELYRRFPELTAREIENRANELRLLADGD